MAPVPSVTGVQVESVAFPFTTKHPGSTKSFFLGGAGFRGLEIQGNFVKFTAIGVYLEGNAVPSLAVKWGGKCAGELAESDDFFADVIRGPFEKFVRVTMILPLSGNQYSEKVSENSIAALKSLGLYTDAEAEAFEKFIEIFKDENFPPGSSIFFGVSESLKIFFSKDGTVPETWTAVIENKLLAEAILASMIGKHGVSPDAKLSLATRVSELLKENKDQVIDHGLLETSRVTEEEKLVELERKEVKVE
ncbi:Chalcone--flavonone isomerase [Morella rubra]|uniref:Chalcone-flavonone isomerase family protein n=2 Tax=Morella rubra TaxID=262757 RepID=A0A6A1VYG0_9ROSI|nr:Chalcone--flavonone isomerase [Morella rubra]